MAGRLESILVPVDFGDASLAALKLAATWGHAIGAQLEVLHVIDTPAFLSPQTTVSFGENGEATSFDEVVREEAVGRMKDLIAKLPGAVQGRIDKRITRGDPLEVIIERSEHHQLIVVGTHAKAGFGRWMLGTLADKLMRSVDGPVVTVHETDEPRLPRTMLVAVDTSAGSRAALLEAAYLAELFEGTIRAVHVVSEPTGIAAEGLFVVGDKPGERISFDQYVRSQADAEVSRFVKDTLGGDVPVDLLVEVGTPGDVIPVAAEDVDLVLMGTRGTTGLERFALGSVASRVVRGSPRPVLTIRRSTR